LENVGKANLFDLFFIILVVTLKLKKMDLIDPSTGLKRSQDKKTAASRARCGLAQADILATGETIVRKDLVFSFIRIMTSMKECGLWIKSMVKEPTGEMMEVS
jgi:hypothetical protein